MAGKTTYAEMAAIEQKGHLSRVKIKGEQHVFTAACCGTQAKEPYADALEIFPDYVKLGLAYDRDTTADHFHVHKEGRFHNVYRNRTLVSRRRGYNSAADLLFKLMGGHRG